jgi:hypothetical protein
VGGGEFVGDDGALAVLSGLDHAFAESVVDGVHAGDQRLEVLDIAEQLVVVLVDLQAVALLLNQDLWNSQLV